MTIRLQAILDQLPAEYPEDLLPSIREEFSESRKTIVVLDDDPTGTQTCYDVNVLTSWRMDLLTEELRKAPSILFILTNSRSLAEGEAVRLTQEVCRNLKAATQLSGRSVLVISRSDSTLRGHFPAEVTAIGDALGLENAVRVLIPAFIEGGRITIDNVHYLIEGDNLVPVSETPFAKDMVFGYHHADLRLWVEEKSRGAVPASDVNPISLEDIRRGGPSRVCEILLSCKARSVCVVNACSFRDLEVIASGIGMAERTGKNLLLRTSATFVPTRAGMPSGKIISPPAPTDQGALVVVGSYVPKTTQQLAHLLERGSFSAVEVDVPGLVRSRDPFGTTTRVAERISREISEGKDVVLHTSRQLETGKNADANLEINQLVSSFLVGVVSQISVRPAFIIAKGGITSSDVASAGLTAETALILGQIIPGVPAWKLDDKSKFPGIVYVVFPGNVGDSTALEQVFNMLRHSGN